MRPPPRLCRAPASCCASSHAPAALDLAEPGLAEPAARSGPAAARDRRHSVPMIRREPTIHEVQQFTKCCWNSAGFVTVRNFRLRFSLVAHAVPAMSKGECLLRQTEFGRGLRSRQRCCSGTTEFQEACRKRCPGQVLGAIRGIDARMDDRL
jgi:hypothetical protein